MHDTRKLYSIKMRASRSHDGHALHISGAERIVPWETLPHHAEALVERAQNHAKGIPNSIHISIAELDVPCLHIPALPVSAAFFSDPHTALAKVFSLLQSVGIHNDEALKRLLPQCRDMRGAMLIDVHSLRRLEPDPSRGIRATCMDAVNGTSVQQKNHFAEALVLASKVAHAPGIVAEWCISDDPAYTTGYVASQAFGYVRIGPMKQQGDPFGGRLFFFDSKRASLQECIAFLEKTPVLIDDVPECPPHTPPTNPTAFFDQHLERLASQNLVRTCLPIISPQGAWITDDKRRSLNLASNDYLGLANDPALRQAAHEAIDRYGAGSGGSRLLTGTNPLHTTLEEELARFLGKEEGILFATGFQANATTIPALCTKGDIILSDALNHASIIDGCRLSGARIVRYAHNDMLDLEKKARALAGRRGLIVSDAVFSMDGDILDFPRFLAIAKRYGFLSMIDGAHAFGVLGQSGRGLEEYFGLPEGADITLGTLSKAFGSEGGFVVGSRSLIQYLKNTARGFIFSTSPGPACTAAAIQALRIIENDSSRVQKLQENIRFFTTLFGKEAGQTPIVPVILGKSEDALACAAQLREEGYYLQAIRYPTVAYNQARLRISLRADHCQNDLEDAAKAILQAVKAFASKYHFPHLCWKQLRSYK